MWIQMPVLWLLDVFLRLVRVHLQPWLRCVQEVNIPVCRISSREANTKNVRILSGLNKYEGPTNVDEHVVVNDGTDAAP